MTLRFERLGGAAVQSRCDTVRDIFMRSYVDAIESGNSFDSPDAFMERFDAYTSNPELDCVLAFDDDTPVGQTWGWPLSERSRWWDGIIGDVDPSFTREDGKRTFALSEIMVAVDRQRRGIAHALHDALLGERCEQRATLLAEPDNDAAYPLYLRWGWWRAAQLRPDWAGAPMFDVLMRDLDDLRARMTVTDTQPPTTP